MSALRDTDQILRAWLEEGPTVLPEPTQRGIEVSTRTTPQRRYAMRLPWRFSDMTTTFKLALGAAAVIAVVLGGWYFFGPSNPTGTGGGPAPSASPSPIATPMPFPTDTGGGVPVAPGTYALDLPTRNSTTGVAAPLRITFTVPAGWQKNRTPTTLWHSTEQLRFGFQTVDNLYVDPCGTGANGLLDPPLGPTVSDLAAGLQGLADLTSTTPTDVSFAGFNGKQLELTAPAEWPSCIDTYRNVFAGPQGAVTDDGGAAIAASETSHSLLLDVDGVRLVIGRAYRRDTSATGLAEMQTILDSVRIERLPVAPSDAPSASP